MWHFRIEELWDTDRGSVTGVSSLAASTSERWHPDCTQGLSMSVWGLSGNGGSGGSAGGHEWGGIFQDWLQCHGKLLQHVYWGIMLTSVSISQYSLQALAVRLGLTEYFPSAVHRQTRLGAILSPLVRTTTTNHSPVLSITSLYLLQVRALEIATDKSTINLKFLHPGSDPDSGHSSMTSAANSVFTSPLKKVR